MEIDDVPTSYQALQLHDTKRYLLEIFGKFRIKSAISAKIFKDEFRAKMLLQGENECM